MKFIAYLFISAICSLAVFFAVSGNNPINFLITTNPLFIICIISAVIILISFIAGWLTDDYSWVDRIWSIAPVIYAWIFTLRAWPDGRLLVMAVLVTLWGIRLTFNLARKGGYSGMEDYRWKEIHKLIPNKFLWQTFNFIFIAFYQNALFILFLLPFYIVFINRGKPAGFLDITAVILFIIFLLLETVADQQQWDFQKNKKKMLETGIKTDKDIERGFLTGGLFHYSRHPNYFAEIVLWWIIYLFSVSAQGQWLHWSAAGAALLTLLFIGSTGMTEMISKRKYPDYAEYQKRTSAIIPWFSKPPAGEADSEKTIQI